MKVLQVLPLVDANRTYGGPVSVSEMQTRSLRDLGHQVTQIACGRPSDAGRSEGSVQLFSFVYAPRFGRWTLSSPSLLRWVHRKAPSFDLIHVHLARDLTMLPVVAVAARRGVPVVVQTHGMVGGEPGLRGLLDRFVSGPVMRMARLQFVLTSREERAISGLIRRSDSLRILENGVTLPTSVGARNPEVPSATSFAFVSRLTERKRPDHFVRACSDLVAAGTSASFTLAGSDDGMGPVVRALIEELGLSDHVSMLGPLPHAEALQVIRGAEVFVLPSVDEPFPMAVLEAMALGTAVVITNECGLADAVQDAGAGLVIDPDQRSLSLAMQRLAGDAELRQACGLAGVDLVQRRYSAERIALRLVDLYEEAIAQRPA